MGGLRAHDHGDGVVRVVDLVQPGDITMDSIFQQELTLLLERLRIGSVRELGPGYDLDGAKCLAAQMGERSERRR